MVLPQLSRSLLVLALPCLWGLPAAAAEPEPVPLDAPPAEAEAPKEGLGFGLGLRVGLDIPTSKLGLFVVGAIDLELLLPVLERRLVLAFDLSYTTPSYDGSGNDARVGGDYDYSILEKELKLGLDLAFRFFTEDRPIIPFIGLGFVIQLLQTVETTSFGPDADHLEQSTELGFELFGGVDFRLGPGFLITELRFVHTGLDHDLTGNTNAGNVSLSVGYRFIF